ncbi:flagellar hook assembly protein FlgD [Oharaeibacter diazotrophicus]|uniref:Basal-body rod modification protein FlgD n=1 Tax=Oharaeibacter diazotrophicus TaxID=1920512 RepID=A0A4R6R9H8_9HYPH|nr:flagellar hook capping FlgD N-terminal domain-containing protein [Oharaeibacter diazotrophicus]TDP82720.1 flagellar basal-body rod modification protein FlgD [Oharaeibacter diazotrophicus]BBE72518.1 basal-body rod modification protein FlgD [Pleomorphomonas sp. SM30]GLS76549.1 flagellar hook assembly protein [Oharaeibacter diazotrophicus]
MSVASTTARTVAAASTASTSATSSTSSTSSSSESSSSTTSAATNSLFANYDMFLKLLTTQLQVQNPLEPMDAEKFTEQLVQYSAVEQQMKTNENLQAMLATMVSSTALSLVNYIGKTVEATSDTTRLETDGTATWKLTAGAEAKGAKVTIRNSAGALIYSGNKDFAKGENTFSWDGKGNDGTTAPAGDYTITVEGTDADGKAVAFSTKVKGVVESIDTSNAEPYLKVNGVLVPLSRLISIGSS